MNNIPLPLLLHENRGGRNDSLPYKRRRRRRKERKETQPTSSSKTFVVFEFVMCFNVM